MLCLPGGRGAILIVGVGVVVVDILPGEDGGARGAAHGRGHEGIDEVRPALLHDAPRLVHHLHGTCNQSGGEMWAGRFPTSVPQSGTKQLEMAAEWSSTGQYPHPGGRGVYVGNLQGQIGGHPWHFWAAASNALLDGPAQ